MINFTIRQKESKYYATPEGGEEFLVGSRTKYQNNLGIVNDPATPTNKYKASDWDDTFGHWAWVVRPTVLAESRTNFEVVNTYDRARFTFGFGQFAAHVPGGDFVRMLRALLARSEASDYYPDLTLVGGKIYKRSGTTATSLEGVTNGETLDLMKYFNPTLTAVENAEVLNAAKLIHWSRFWLGHRRIQVQVMMETAKKLVARYPNELNGRRDFVALMVMDIHHQGRAKKDVVLAALQEPDDEKALTALLKIGETTYPQRIATLKTEIARLRAENMLGTKKYKAGDGSFA